MPKNLALQRINTKALQSSGQILYKKVITTKLATTQELQIQAEPEYVSGYNESVNFVYFEVLQTAMENITATLKAYIEERVTDITISFEAHVKSRLNNATETFKRQMEDHIDNATSNLQIYIENLDQQIYTLSNQTNNRIATTKTECENTKKKLSSLVECSNARIPVVYGKGGYGSNEAVNRLISAIGDGPKKLFDKSYVRLVAAAGDPRIFTIKCWSNDVTLDTVVLTDGSEMAFEFSD
uniref:Uncharacterized protein n=1 Tax=Panagrolaimus superbus TaxID=310955 RepID=A0A914XW61_9BILA